ncbi:MAG: T9SS type A sorting domain-containing protein, partial [Bacteroidales bacterium]
IGLSDINSQTIMKLYPNPTKEITRLEIEGLKSKAEVKVFDILGREKNRYKIEENQKSLDIDVKTLEKGVYNISIQNNEINLTKKLIVH